MGLELIEQNSHETDVICAAVRSRLSDFSAHSLRCLDVGAGTGRLLRCLVDHISTATAVEPDVELACYLRSCSFPFPVTVECQRIEDYSRFTTESFDLILLSHVMYYVAREQWPAVLARLRSLLTPNGLLVAILWSRDSGYHRLAVDAFPEVAWPTIEELEPVISERFTSYSSLAIRSYIEVATTDDWRALGDLLERSRPDAPSADTTVERFARDRTGSATVDNAQAIIFATT